MTATAAPVQMETALAAEVSKPPMKSAPEIVETSTKKSAPELLETPTISAEKDTDHDDGAELARHLERRTRDEGDVASSQWSDSEGGSLITLGKIQAGYGEIFKGESTALRGHNGTAWEEPSVVFLKASFRF